MHLLVTGATGFIGQAVVREALSRGHQVTAVTRDSTRARLLLPPPVFVVEFGDLATMTSVSRFDGVIHLAWAEVGKYSDPANLLGNLEPQFLFLQSLVNAGLRNFTIAGSCLEYGMQQGALAEDIHAKPVTYYGLAKVTLWQMLAMLQHEHPNLQLKWLRYFYVYGAGQRDKALLPQLLAALERGDKSFRMSPGDQGRDFIHVSTVASNTVTAAETADDLGIVNIAGGRSLKVLDFVEEVIRLKGRRMTLETGAYGYPAYEPFSFHGDTTKLRSIPGMKVVNEIIL
jgi:nucleoside-diphosphate-sugar epimerase